MRMLMLGAATLALVASAGWADPGKGHGGGGGHGNGGGPAAAEHGGGKSHGGGGEDRGPGGGHGNGGAMHAAQVERGPQGGDHGKAMRGADRQEVRRAEVREADGNGNGNAKHGADEVRHSMRDARSPSRDVREVRIDRDDDGRGDGRTRIVRTVVNFDRSGARGLIDGCPPGLAKKNNGCMPPGLARERDESYYRPSWFGYPSYNDGRYYYDDGYLYRTSNTGSVLGYIPLLGGALSVGNPWPNYYRPVPVPDYYVDYYNLGSPDSYRYADDVLYRVDPQSDAITSIAALLTGDQFGIGQRMPAGYDIYNVPYAYRDQYYDTPDSMYRYADGYVYQVDPTTQLIQAAIQLLT